MFIYVVLVDSGSAIGSVCILGGRFFLDGLSFCRTARKKAIGVGDSDWKNHDNARSPLYGLPRLALEEPGDPDQPLPEAVSAPRRECSDVYFLGLVEAMTTTMREGT